MIENILKKGVILSCQPAGEDESFYDIEFIIRFSLAAEFGKAVALRLEGCRTISTIKNISTLPIIGLTKKTKENSIYKRNITTTIDDIECLFNAGADIIAVDFTLRENKDEKYFINMMNEVRNGFKFAKILADISNYKEAKMAENCDVDYISTTLSGYTYYTKNTLLPDFKLLNTLLRNINKPIIAEGGYAEMNHIKKAVKLGCKNIVIGTALTRPHIMIGKFNKIWENYE